MLQAINKNSTFDTWLKYYKKSALVSSALKLRAVLHLVLTNGGVSKLRDSHVSISAHVVGSHVHLFASAANWEM